MKKYECLYIVNTNYDSEGTSAVVAKVEEVLKSIGAELANTQHWGKRKLAYAIDKERYGNYILVHFQGEDPNIDELQREFEIEKGILHYMTIRLEDFPDFETLSVPQAFETDRRHSGYGGGRKPRRYEDDAQSGKTAEENAEKSKDVQKTADATEETEVVETVAPAVEEVTESAEEAVIEEADKSADAE